MFVAQNEEAWDHATLYFQYAFLLLSAEMGIFCTWFLNIKSSLQVKAVRYLLLVDLKVSSFIF